MKYLRIVMLAAGMILMAGGATFLAKNYARGAEARGWPRAQARITESRLDTIQAQQVGNTGDFLPHVRYDYVVHGRTFHGETIWLDERRSFGSANVAARELAFLETGTQVEVMYNPQDPHEAALSVDKPTWRFFLVFLLGAILTRLGWPRRRPKAPGQELVPA